MTDPLSHHHSSPSPRLFLFAAVIFHLFLSALIIPPLSFTSAKLVFPLPPHLAFPPPPLHLPLPAFPVFIPTLFCEQLNVYFMSASSSILPWPLLGGFALLFHILFVPLFAVSIKDGIEISCANARAHTHTRVRAEASHCHTRRLTKQRHAVPRHMKEHKPLVLLLLYLLLILSLHFSLSQPPTPSSFFFSCCKCGAKQICVCIFFI